jgi:hypothetical protein
MAGAGGASIIAGWNYGTYVVRRQAMIGWLSSWMRPSSRPSEMQRAFFLSDFALTNSKSCHRVEATQRAAKTARPNKEIRNVKIAIAVKAAAARI